MADAFISEEDVQKVREASDIVAVIGERAPLKQRGRDFWCCCPIHNEKTPSCKLDPMRQLWHCFGCGEGGDVFAFIMKVEDLTFPEAVRYLADRAHVPITEVRGKQSVSSSEKARCKAVCAATAEFFHLQLMRGKDEGAASARAYLAGRDLGGSIPKKWNLGFAPGRGTLVRYLSGQGFSANEMVKANVATRGSDGRVRDRFFNRIMFPICDAAGECIAFGGRVIGKGEPKYLNTQETAIFHKSQVLYGLHHAKSAMASTGVAVVVEGYTDVIALHERGIMNAVATLGTALTIQHIRLLSRHAQKKIVYLFDGDAAGQRAADRALQFIDDSMTPEAGRSRVELCAVTLPGSLDPADFVAQEGADALQALIDDAQPLLKYGIERRLARYDLTSAEGRAQALAEALEVLAPIKDSLLAKDYAAQIAGRVRARESDVLDQLALLKKPAFRDEEEPAVSAPAAGLPQGGAQAEAPAVPLSEGETNRRRFERELLSLLAQHPLLGLEYADALAQVQWHDSLCATVAQSILETLSANPGANAAQVITEASKVNAAAAGLLTSGTMAAAEHTPENVARFLAEELSLGDTEEAIAGLRAQLSDTSSLPAEEVEMLFQSIAAMQKDLNARKAAHKPLA